MHHGVQYPELLHVPSELNVPGPDFAVCNHNQNQTDALNDGSALTCFTARMPYCNIHRLWC